MNISEFAKPVTAKSLNESLARRYKTKINLESYTLSQLQNARNILRTKLSQVEVSESFSTVIESESYQKSKLMLDILNAAISERGDIDDEVLEAAKPDYIDIDGDGDTEEPMKKAVKDKEKKKKTDEAKKVPNRDGSGNLMPYRSSDGKCAPGYVLEKNKRGMMCVPKASAASTFAKESIVREGAEDQAELVMAAKDMVDRLTGWMEDTAEMQTESMLELADAIRDEMGQEASDSFTNAVKPALEQLYASMETTRQALTGGVGQLTGEAQPAPDMGAEPEPEMEPTVDGEGDLDAELSTDAAAPAAGGEEEAGREKRESRDYRDIAKAVMERTRRKSVAESSQKLASILSKKKD